jgi:hypothetical protein
VCRQPLTSVQGGFEYKKRDIKFNEEIKSLKRKTDKGAPHTHARTHARAGAKLTKGGWVLFGKLLTSIKFGNY